MAPGITIKLAYGHDICMFTISHAQVHVNTHPICFNLNPLRQCSQFVTHWAKLLPYNSYHSKGMSWIKIPIFFLGRLKYSCFSYSRADPKTLELLNKPLSSLSASELLSGNKTASKGNSNFVWTRVKHLKQMTTAWFNQWEADSADSGEN